MYCIIHNNKIVAGPQQRPAVYNGIKNFNFLSNEELKTHGWYPVIEVNSQYDPRYQTRSKSQLDFDGEQITATYVVTDIPIETVREKKIKELAQKRWEVETSGIDLGDSTILTDRESQAQISSAYAAAKNGLLTSLNFKSANGWIVLTSEQMIYIGEAVYTHVQNCFNKEKEHYDNIMNLQTSLEIVEYNIEEGW